MQPIPLYVRGPYRVLELRDDDRDRPFVVVDTAGACLHEDASFAGARDWADRRDAHEPVPAARRPRRMR